MLSIALVGCDEYPGHRKDGAQGTSNNPISTQKMTDKPSWGRIAQEYSFGGDCHIDSINDEPGEGLANYTVKQGAILKVVGWGAISAKEGVIANDIALALKNNSVESHRLFAKATKWKRPDVAEYFKNPSSVDSGFRVAIDLSDVPSGNYLLEVIQHKDGKSLKCHHIAKIIIEK